MYTSVSINEKRLLVTDYRTDDWLIVNTPFPILTIIALYLYLSTNFGPKCMQTRQPFNLKYVIAFYNLFQVVGNLYLVFYVSRTSVTMFYWKFNWLCFDRFGDGHTGMKIFILAARRQHHLRTYPNVA